MKDSTITGVPDATQIRIRKATATDAAAIAELWLSCTQEVAAFAPIYRPALAHEALRDFLDAELASGARYGWVAIDGNAVVGYAMCRIDEESPIFVARRFVYLIDLDVAASHRKQGLSRRLLAAVEDDARGRGIDRLELAFAAADPRSRAVWERQGFKPHLIHMHKDLSAC